MNRNGVFRRVRWLARLVVGAGLALLIASPGFADNATPTVYALPTSGTVDQVMAGYVRDGISKAQREGATAVLIELNTPGGDLNAMRDIVTTLLTSPLPVITWVGPDGGRAASAGTFIAMAGNVATMARASNIGAATPIDSSGQNIGSDLQSKILQDTEAILRAISDARSRNYDQAVTAVTDARSFTGPEALSAGLIDGLAQSPAEAVAFANGRTINVGGQQVNLGLENAQIVETDMNPLQSLLHLLADPNIAFILFTLGFYGLLFELWNPNLLTGTLGAISIILAFLGFGSLPLNLGGLLLIGLGIVLFGIDLHITNHGLPTVGGLVCFVLGAGALYTEPSTGAPDISVALPVIVTMAVLTGAFMALIVYVASKTRNVKTAPGLVGSGVLPLAGEVRRPLTPIGSVYAGGEEWTARSADETPLGRGTPVKILRQEGLTLIVENNEGVAGA